MKKKICAFMLLVSVAGCMTIASACKEESRTYVYAAAIENAGFERGDLSGWSATGDAFSVSEDSDGSKGAEGRFYLKGSAEKIGELRSETFVLQDTGYISFLIGAGEGDCYVGFYVDNTLVKSVTNPYFNNNRDDAMRRVLVDMKEYLHKKIYIKIVDNASDLLYSYINADAFDVNVTPTDYAVYKGISMEV